MSGEEEVSLQDYIDFYPEGKLPFSYGDTSFPKKENDSLLIANDIFFKFMPDSIVQKAFNNKLSPKYYALTKFKGDNEVYLITKAITKQKKVLFISAYDKDYKFIAGMPLMWVDSTMFDILVTIDPKYNISKSLTSKLRNETGVTGHSTYVLNNAAKTFMLVMTDSLGDAVRELSNPIDTLLRTQKFAADYGEGKMNLVSIRDGQSEGRIHFFIHLEKGNGDCVGELKGEAVFTGPNVAEYRQGGDPCVIKFNFSNTAVTLTEVEGCGSRMGALQCTFNGSYPKKKAPKKLNDAEAKKPNDKKTAQKSSIKK